MADNNAVIRATTLGTIAQLAMVVSGHYVAMIKDNLFAVLGMAISLVAGVLYARMGTMPSRGSAATGGAMVGGICALIGIAVSVALSDVPALILLVGTLSSAVTGAIGGALAHVKSRA